MKSTIWTTISAIMLFSVLAFATGLGGQNQQAQQPSHYRVFALGALGGNSSDGNAINNLGWVLGEANITGNTAVHATLWNNDLGTLGGPDSDIQWPNKNDHGVLAGISETADRNPYNEPWSCVAFFFGVPTGYDCVGFKWQNGVMTTLPTLGGPNAFAASINNHDQIVGWAENTLHDPTCKGGQVFQFEAVVWEPDGQVRQLSPFQSDQDGAATAINDNGQVVGISGDCDVAVGATSARHALLWENGQPMDLGNLGGHSWNTPMDLNNAGVVVGFANAADLPLVNGQPPIDPVPFYWTKETGVMKQLPLLPNDVNGVAYGINNLGQIVGASNESNGTTRAVIWQNGKVTDLNQQLLAQNSPLFLALAQGINDRGEITGFCIDSTNGEVLAFVAVPTSNSDQNGDTNSAVQEEGAKGNVVLPENARKQLTQRWPFALTGRPAMPR